MAKGQPIYLDNFATTCCDPRVVTRMLPYFSQHYGNAGSRGHSFGWRAAAAVDLAREQVATSIGGNASEIIFCSGATEANNLALRGVAQSHGASPGHLVVVATEHASVLDCARSLRALGWRLTILPVQGDGRLSSSALREALRSDTALVSVMLVNNEIGVVQDVRALAACVYEYAPASVFHCDAVQALGKIPVDVSELGVDLLSISSHKVYGPKGVGALWCRRRPKVALTQQNVGGGQEGGLRSGTLPVPLVVGFGLACELAVEAGPEEQERLLALRMRLLQGLRDRRLGVLVNGSEEHRVAGNLNVSLDGVYADALLPATSGVAMSTGSACTSAEGKASHVLAAIVSPERARCSIRLGIGRFTTDEEIEEAIECIASGARALRGS